MIPQVQISPGLPTVPVERFVGFPQCLQANTVNVRECIQKFPDRVDNEINNNKHSLRSNTKGYGGKTH
jgi:hypothetical protein